MDENNLDWRFAKGGEQELRAAIELYGQPLLRYCHNILCDYAEAQDAVQNTFIKAYGKRRSFKSGTSLSSWLYRIAYTTCMDIVRKKRWLVFMPHVQVRAKSVASDENFISDDLRKALQELSPDERALVFSRVIDKKSYAELESVYQTSAATLRKRHQRAKAKLVRALRGINSYYSRLEERK